MRLRRHNICWVEDNTYKGFIEVFDNFGYVGTLYGTYLATVTECVNKDVVEIHINSPMLDEKDISLLKTELKPLILKTHKTEKTTYDFNFNLQERNRQKMDNAIQNF